LTHYEVHVREKKFLNECKNKLIVAGVAQLPPPPLVGGHGSQDMKIANGEGKKRAFSLIGSTLECI